MEHPFWLSLVTECTPSIANEGASTSLGHVNSVILGLLVCSLLRLFQDSSSKDDFSRNVACQSEVTREAPGDSLGSAW